MINGGLSIHTHDGLFHGWDEQGSSLSNELMPGGFPIAPQWISPILTAGLTATEWSFGLRVGRNCTCASAFVDCRLNARHTLGEVGGRGDEMRLWGVVLHDSTFTPSPTIKECRPPTTLSSILKRSRISLKPGLPSGYDKF